jgi:tRNA threonylcarbamoyladenosine biosynthesis protein TsaE
MIKRQTYISNSPEETFSIGKKLASTLTGGEVLALVGDLGAGKTVFVQGLAVGLRVKELVNSPTYIIMKLYKANRGVIKQLCHVDAYRLSSGLELKDIGVDEYFGLIDTVTALEWPEKIEEILPKDYIHISIETRGENIRKIIIK